MPMLVLLVMVILVVVLLDGVISQNFTTERSRMLSGSKGDCKIIVYDQVRGYLNWLQDWFKQAAFTKCNKRVTIKDRRTDSKDVTADILLFHGPTHNMVIGHIKKAFTREDGSKPVFAMISMEQPKYAKILSNIEYMNKNLDLVLTYSLSSIYPSSTVPNMPITYFPLNILAPNAVMHPPRPFNEKLGYSDGAVTVAVFVSNCKTAGANQRLAYLKELMTHIKVHSYGKCFNNVKEPEFPYDKGWPDIAQKRANKVKLLSQYKFYLAFENSPVPDYVSEKVFEGLFAGTVPVYRGAASIGRFMPSNSSFIDANNLTPLELATKLKNIGEKEAEYSHFFAFKKQPISEEFMNIALMSYNHPNVLCRLCDYGLSE